METITRKLEIIEALKELVGKRTTKEEIESKLTKLTGVPVVMEDISKDDDELVDFNLIGNIDDGKELFCDFDVYFLKMRNKGFDGSDILVTEVSFNFE